MKAEKDLNSSFIPMWLRNLLDGDNTLESLRKLAVEETGGEGLLSS